MIDQLSRRLSRYMYHYRYGLYVVLAGTAFFMANVPLRPELWLVSTIAIFLFATPVIIGTLQWLGLRRGAGLLIALGLYALLFETVAIRSGIPYGQFTYTDILGPKLFAAAPVTVLLAWTPLILGVLAYTEQIVSIGKRLVLSTLLLVCVDLVLDPSAVYLGFWFWQTPGPYYGVPLANFAGWLVSGSIALGGVLLAARRWHWPRLNAAGNRSLAHTPAVPIGTPLLGRALYFILFFWTALNAWAGLAVPAIIGVVLCLSFARRFMGSKDYIIT